MPKKIKSRFFQFFGVIVFLGLFSIASTAPLVAQNLDSRQASQLQPLHSGVALYDFTGDLRWQTYYSPVGIQHENGRDVIKLGQKSQTVLNVQFRNIYMLNRHVGLGYNVLATVYMSGFFKGVGLGGVGAGPIARFYLLRSTRWQPYLQGNFLAGYNLVLGTARSINDVDDVRYRTGLRGGLNYKVSNAFGIFFEIGPEWEYDEQFLLDTHALEINIGIEFFRF